MKITISLFLVFMLLLAAAPDVLAGCGSCGASHDSGGEEYDSGSEQGEHTPRYDRIQRDLHRQYEEGALTKTEYIQRQRELEDMGEE